MAKSKANEMEKPKVNKPNKVRTAILKATGADVVIAGFAPGRRGSNLSAETFASLTRQPPQPKPKPKKKK